MKKIHINFMISEGEKKMLSELSERFSCNYSELIRGWLRWNHSKTFPAYKKASVRVFEIREDLTPEQICESKGGKVGKDKMGNPVCRKAYGKDGAMEVQIFLSTPNLAKKLEEYQ